MLYSTRVISQRIRVIRILDAGVGKVSRMGLFYSQKCGGFAMNLLRVLDHQTTPQKPPRQAMPATPPQEGN
jgi:hypothetical protein